VRTNDNANANEEVIDWSRSRSRVVPRGPRGPTEPDEHKQRNSNSAGTDTDGGRAAEAQAELNHRAETTGLRFRIFELRLDVVDLAAVQEENAALRNALTDDEDLARSIRRDRPFVCASTHLPQCMYVDKMICQNRSNLPIVNPLVLLILQDSDQNPPKPTRALLALLTPPPLGLSS
jgi:hypothetical protein